MQAFLIIVSATASAVFSTTKPWALSQCAPMSLLMEQAGGMSSDGKMRLLDKELKDLGQRSPIFIGSNEEVKRCEEYLD